MPLPTPNDQESESDFVARCVGSDAAKEFKDEKQRVAVCYSQWRRDKRQASYYTTVQAVERDGKKYALIEIIDESECKNKWRINPAGKARALVGILETPLLGPPVLGHEGIDTIGHPVDFTSNHATRVLYEIKNPAHWERIRTGEWGTVSPQLTFLTDHYEGDTQVIDEWRFDHVAFVEKGAFPNIGVKATCEDDPRLCGFSKAVTAAFDGHGLDPSGPEPRQDVAGYSNNRQPDREKIGDHSSSGVIEKNMEVDTMSCEHDKVIAELTDKNKTLDAQVKDLTEKHKTIEGQYNELTAKNKTVEAELKQAKASSTTVTASKEALDKVEAELKVVKAENESFKAWKQASEDADHMERVQAVLDLRVKAGLLETKDVAAAIDTFKNLDNKALDLMVTDLTKIHGKFDSLPSGPKAKLIPTTVSARFDPTQATIGDLVGKPLGVVKQ